MAALASISDRMGAMGGGKPMPHKPEMPSAEKHSGGGHTELHDHGDGTYHSVTSDGTKTEHPHIGHAVVHIAKHHESDGAHSHVHHHDGGHTSHHEKDGGEITGPHEADDLEGVKQNMEEATGDGESSGYEHGGSENYASKGESHKELF